MWSKRTSGDLSLNVLRYRKQKGTTEKEKRAGKYKKRERKGKGIIAVMGCNVCFSPFSFSLCNFFEAFEN